LWNTGTSGVEFDADSATLCLLEVVADAAGDALAEMRVPAATEVHHVHRPRFLDRSCYSEAGRPLVHRVVPSTDADGQRAATPQVLHQRSDVR
jgi:hypothetical protein